MKIILNYKNSYFKNKFKNKILKKKYQILILKLKYYKYNKCKYFFKIELLKDVILTKKWLV